MPLITDYTTLATMRDFRRIETPADIADDNELSTAITAASREIDAHCSRHFGQSAAPEARTYTWGGTHVAVTGAGRARVLLPALEVDDISTSVGLVVKTDADGDGAYETTVAASAYQLWPLNAAGDGEPWTRIVLRQAASASFPAGPGAIEVTARWGWASVPTDVAQACLLQANRLAGRRDSWAGVAGSPEMGNELRLLSKLDADAVRLLAGRRRIWLAA